jgi:UDP-N-acetyl-D-glucosamine dehydrogenase
VTEHRLRLAVNGREHQLRGHLVSFPLPEHAGGTGHVDCNGQGAGYKAGVSDLRESSAMPLIASLLRESADVRYYDPLVSVLTAPGGLTLNSEPDPGTDWDLVIVHTTHPDVDYAWARKCHVLDATYQFDDASERVVV